MTHRRLIAAAGAIAAAGLGLGLGFGLTAAASPAGQAVSPAGQAVSPASKASPASEPVAVNCLDKAQVQPGSYVLTCADANTVLTRLAWTSWTSRLASATGTLSQNDCIPYCAAGHLHDYPVLVVFWGSAPYHGAARYTEATLIFPGPRPQVFNGRQWTEGPQTETLPLWPG
jgi:hypothetical protein